MFNKNNDNIKSQISKEICTGCTACYSSCPKHCISMEYDEEGFCFPVVNEQLCNHCGLCVRRCPLKNDYYNYPRKLYAAKIKDSNSRLKSSSGGVANLLSEFILRAGGVVYGAVMQNFIVVHKRIDSIDNLQSIQSSKYVQSELGDTFLNIQKDLNERLVLFFGTPCQVAGLKSFLKRKNSNLICVDFICHGVPSPGVFKKYSSELREKFYSAEKLLFRDKLNSWNPLHAISLYNANGDLLFRESGQFNVYLRSFLTNVINRKGCGKCLFSRFERVGDLTLGDFWGIREVKHDFDDGKGVSLVLINTEAGDRIYSSVQNTKLLQDYEFEDKLVANKFQVNLNCPSKESYKRSEFFSFYKLNSHLIAYLSKKVFNVGILNFHFANNYGAVLVPYAMLKVLNNLGYTGEIINYIPDNTPPAASFKNFRCKYLKPISAVLRTREQLSSFSRWWKYVIVGSDQVWRIYDTGIYMLNWTSGLTNFISYACSFGNDYYCGSLPLKTAKSLIQRFDSISVRERSGINICKKNFDVEALQVLDPTLLLSQSDYNELIDKEKSNFEISLSGKYVAYSFINSQKHIDDIKNGIAKDIFCKQNLVNCLWDGKKFRNVAEWIYIIKNSEFVISDSFHAIVFSIIFNKKFIALIPVDSGNGNDRILSLLETLEIPSGRILSSVNDVTLELINQYIDWDNVNRLIKNKQGVSIDFLINSLNKDLNEKADIIQIR